MATFKVKVTVDSRGIINRVGEGIRNGIKKTADSIQTVDAEKKTSRLGALISDKYKNYLNQNPYLADVDDDQKIDIVISERKLGGYNLKVQGKNVLYYEYGTGTRGLQNPHSNKPAKLKPYGDGRYIINNGKRNNGRPLPKWYPFNEDGSPKPMNMSLLMANTDKDLGSVKNIKLSDYVWKHHGTITKGAPAGKFIYDSLVEFQKTFGEEAGITAYKKSISVRIKDNIRNEIKG